jgi:preprotein translocase subunit SecG
VILVSGIISKENLDSIEGFRSVKPISMKFLDKLFYFLIWGFFILLVVLYITQKQHFMTPG